MRHSRKASTARPRRGQIIEAVSIRERPLEVEERAVPGVTVSVSGDFWRAVESGGKGRAIRTLALQELLRGRWNDVTRISYHPSADGYIKDRHTILQMVIEGVTDR